MSTGFRGAFIRGVASQLRQDDGVDAGAASDCLVNNVGHIYDAHHPHIVNFVSEVGLANALRQDEPSAYEYRLIDRWPFRLITAADGGSANIVYRFKGYRSGGSGNSIFGIRIGTSSIARFLSETRTYQASHTIAGTTPTAASGVLYVRHEGMTRYPEVTMSGAYAGSGAPAGSGPVRLAWFEVWCLMDGTKPSIRVSSLMARQFVRL